MATSSSLSCAVVFPSLLSSSKSQFARSLALPSTNSSCRFSMSAEWIPGQPRPPYLDGSAPGDYGFDPLRLGEVPENLERFKESELIHCRWAMLAVAAAATSFSPLLGPLEASRPTPAAPSFALSSTGLTASSMVASDSSSLSRPELSIPTLIGQRVASWWDSKSHAHSRKTCMGPPRSSLARLSLPSPRSLPSSPPDCSTTFSWWFRAPPRIELQSEDGGIKSNSRDEMERVP